MLQNRQEEQPISLRYRALVSIAACLSSPTVISYLDMHKYAEALQCFDHSIQGVDDYLAAHRGRLAALEGLKKDDLVRVEREKIKSYESDFRPNK